MPNCLDNVTVTDQKCPKCTHVNVNLLQMKFNRRSAPPGFPPEVRNGGRGERGAVSRGEGRGERGEGRGERRGGRGERGER